MLSVLPLWVVLNTYAFLLDVLFIVGGTGSWLLFSSGYLFRGWVAAAISAIFIFSAVRVHLSYPAKLKAYKALYKRNKNTFHRASFYDFMDAPCYRMVVRAVLNHTGHPEEYDSILKEVWGSGFSPCTVDAGTVTVFQNAEDGERWLRSHAVECEARAARRLSRRRREIFWSIIGGCSVRQGRVLQARSEGSVRLYSTRAASDARREIARNAPPKF